MIEVKNIKKAFGDRTVIEDVSAVMKAGQCNLIIGSSGSGKTVLMKCMVGLFEPDEGDILYGGQNFTQMNTNDKTEMMATIPNDPTPISAHWCMNSFQYILAFSGRANMPFSIRRYWPISRNMVIKNFRM